MIVHNLAPLQAQLHQFFCQPSRDARRLFHGRGQCYEGLNFITVDWFEPVIWVVIYQEQSDQCNQAIEALLIHTAKSNDAIQTVAVQYRKKPTIQHKVIYGLMPDKVLAKENGLQHLLNLSANQNIGFFMDAQPARQWLQGQVKDKVVLNLFSYTCAFSLAALKHGASKVINIDMAKSVIATGQRNHALNQLNDGRAVFLSHDIFRSIKKLLQYAPYDTVIIDPPSHQKGSFVAIKDYTRLLDKIRPLLAKQCEILACVNAPYLDDDFLAGIMAERMPDFSFQTRLDNRLDFPEKHLGKSIKMCIYKR